MVRWFFGWGIEQAAQVKRAAGFGAGARQAVATEWLGADDSADNVAVDVDIACMNPADNAGYVCGNAGMQAEGEAVAGGVDGIDNAVEISAAVAHDVQDRAENFLGNIGDVVDLNDRGAMNCPGGVALVVMVKFLARMAAI